MPAVAKRPVYARMVEWDGEYDHDYLVEVKNICAGAAIELRNLEKETRKYVHFIIARAKHSTIVQIMRKIALPYIFIDAIQVPRILRGYYYKDASLDYETLDHIIKL